MATEPTFFDLPITPDEFGVVLPPPNLRRINFSALDFPTSQRAIIEYIKTYFPDDFNDFVASNGIMMLTEIMSAVMAKLSLRSDLNGNEGTLPTARSEEAVVNHLALINQRIKRQTPANADIECTVDQPTFSNIEIPASTSFTTAGPDGSVVTYELYRTPNDWTSSIIVPAGKRGVIAFGLEGQFASPAVVSSPGGANQKFVIADDNILESPIFVNVQLGNEIEEWEVVLEPIEKFGPNDKVVEVNFINNNAIFRFGDDVTGSAPLSGSTITFRYRIGGGVRGRIGVGQIDTARQFTPLPPANAVVSVRFRNISPSNGGTDKETIEQAKRRAPRDFALQQSIVTSEDYAQAAISFTHPVFGAINKAVATIRTSRNANLIEIYALAEGPDDIPITPSAGLKRGLSTYFSNLNVLSDSLEVLDGAIKPVDIDMAIVVNRNADASVVKEQVEQAITDFFDIANWNMGQALFISNFIEVIEAIDGVSYLDLFKPVDNILPTGELADSTSVGVGFNEVIVEGNRKTNYFYEKSPPPGGVRKS